MRNIQDFHIEVQRTSPPFFSIADGSAMPVMASTAGTLNMGRVILGRFIRSLPAEGLFAYNTFTIDDLPSDTHSLMQSIEAKISYTDGEYLAEFAEAEIVTSGETSEDAIQWLKETIVSLYEFYNDNRGTLGSLPERQLSILEAYIAEKQAREA